jgi:hypothetical protein
VFEQWHMKLNTLQLRDCFGTIAIDNK